VFQPTVPTASPPPLHKQQKPIMAIVAGLNNSISKKLKYDPIYNFKQPHVLYSYFACGIKEKLG